MMIDNSSTISLHFSLALENGDVIDSTFAKQPATFTMGDGSLLPGFERQLIGLVSGDKKTVIVAKERAFGAHNPQNLQRFKRSDFDKDAQFSDGMMFTFTDAAGGELPGVVSSFDDDQVMIDFNHPLAGHDITFKVEITNVR